MCVNLNFTQKLGIFLTVGTAVLYPLLTSKHPAPCITAWCPLQTAACVGDTACRDTLWVRIFMYVVYLSYVFLFFTGFNLFVLQGMANKDMGYIARSAFPLFLLMILAVIVIIIFPEIALWLPQQMVQNIN